MASIDEKVEKFAAFSAALTATKLTAQEAPFTNGTSQKQRYVVRVVLHRTDGSSEYDELHEAMENLGFKKLVTGRNIVSGASETDKLPGGLYYHNRGYFVNPFRREKLGKGYAEVKEAVRSVVDANPALYKANMPPSIFIAEVNVALWSGLDDAPKK